MEEQDQIQTNKDRFYELCCRKNDPIVIEKIRGFERKEVPDMILTEEEVNFVNSCLYCEDFDVNSKVHYICYLDRAFSSKNYQLAGLIIQNNRFDFKSLQIDVLHSLCTFKQYNLIRQILKDPRFDGDLLNEQTRYSNGFRTILHSLCQYDVDDNLDIIELITNNEKFTGLNNVDEYGLTALFVVCSKSFNGVKLITNHKNFDPNTLILRTKEEGWSVLQMGCGHDTFMYILKLFEDKGLMDYFGVKQTMFNSCKYGLSVPNSLVGSDSDYVTFCEFIKFVEKHKMRELVWKDYVSNPDETINKITCGTYDHNYDPNYFLDFPVEAISKVVNWYIWKKR